MKSAPPCLIHHLTRRAGSTLYLQGHFKDLPKTLRVLPSLLIDPLLPPPPERWCSGQAPSQGLDLRSILTRLFEQQES